jgi:hypothetical protein
MPRGVTLVYSPPGRISLSQGGVSRGSSGGTPAGGATSERAIGMQLSLERRVQTGIQTPFEQGFLSSGVTVRIGKRQGSISSMVLHWRMWLPLTTIVAESRACSRQQCMVTRGQPDRAREATSLAVALAEINPSRLLYLPLAYLPSK